MQYFVTESLEFLLLLGGYVTSVCTSSLMFLHQNLLVDKYWSQMYIQRWIEGNRWYRNENILWIYYCDCCFLIFWKCFAITEKRRGSPVFNKIGTSKNFKLLQFDDANSRRTRSNDNVEFVRNVFEIWNQYIQGGKCPRFVIGSW